MFKKLLLCCLVTAGLSVATTTEARSGGKHAARERPAKATVHAGHARTAARRAGPVATKGHKRSRPKLVVRNIEPAPTSIGQAIGLHEVDDPLDLKSAVALVVDQQMQGMLFEKNASAVLPIASITKLMTAMVVLDAQQPMNEIIEVSEADIDTEKNSRSRLRPGSRLNRAEMLQAALMSSENRAANALGRYYPGGLRVFVAAMNQKARSLGMNDSNFVDPTGLSSQNVANARDLAKMVRAASTYPIIREYSTATEMSVDTGLRHVLFRNTNRLVDSPSWEIELQKTGYINEAGNCLVMQTRIDGRPVIIVLLDAVGRQSRFADAVRLKHWLEAALPKSAAVSARFVRTAGHGRVVRNRASLGS